ncbi:MAG: hypothetical protein RLZ10_2579 [Bacteroidota bacterium]
MSNELIVVLSFFWLVSATYVMVYHSKRWKLTLEIIIGAIILGPILALLIGDDEEKILKEKRRKEKESNERHIGWFRTISEINRQRLPSFGRSVPPPPPISRIERARTERDEAIRTAIERIEPPNRRPNNKDFKFFRG